jgi:hypothetical protein
MGHAASLAQSPFRNKTNAQVNQLLMGPFFKDGDGFDFIT